MAKSTAEETSERKRVSIPKADESVLAWWSEQNDPSLSVRLLIRSEIERSGYTDTAFRPLAQLPRRGRPPAGVAEVDPVADGESIGPGAPITGGTLHTLHEGSESADYAPTGTGNLAQASAPTPQPQTPLRTPVANITTTPPVEQQKQSFRGLDELMNG